MKTIGLTGPSGAGKGYCYRFFESLGIACIDTDDVYHKLLIPPSDCVDELVLEFGSTIIGENGSVNRKELANIVFSDETRQKLGRLNQITHKYVLKRTHELIKKNEGKRAVVIDAPLLFEADFDKFCNFTIAIICDSKTRLERIMKRDSISEEAALMRIGSQPTDEFYTSKATYSVCNEGQRECLEQKLNDILKKENII